MTSGTREIPMKVVDVERDVLMSRYLAGRLSDDEAERFEAWWAENPQATRDLEAGARLRSGLADLQRRGELPTVVRGAWWSRPLALLSIAASVAAFAVGAAVWFIAAREPSIPLAAAIGSLPRHSAGTLALGETYSLLRLRSASADAVVSLPAEPRALAFRVLPEQPSSDGRYRVEFARDGERQVATGAVAGLAPAPDGFVDVYVDSRGLEPGRYRLTVAPTGAAPSVFVVDVRRPPGSG
jgi:hypothetical protein